MKYSPLVVTEFFIDCGLPPPIYEHRFHPTRKWRFDLAWPKHLIYLEVDGGIWIAGGHNRGAQIKKDWEKRNAASALGWRGIWCEPKDLCSQEIAECLAACIGTPSQ